MILHNLWIFLPALVFLLLCIGGHFYTQQPPAPPLQYRHWQIPQDADLSAELVMQTREIAESSRYFGGKIRDPFHSEVRNDN